MIVNTNTVCPFPYTTPDGIINASDPSECTVTYAEALGAGHTALQVLLVLTGVVGVVVFGYRIYALKKYCEAKRLVYYKHATLVHFVLCFAFNLFLIVGSFDVFGFWDIMPVQVYAAIDEICASLAITNGLMVVRFLYKMSNGVHNPKKKESMILTYSTVVAIWINFIGFMIASLVDYPRYRLYDGLKCLVGAIILFVFAIFASVFAIKLRILMMSMASQLNDRTHLERHLHTLRVKHLRFSIVLLLAVIALLVNAAISITAEDKRWTLAIDELPDPAQIGFRIIFILNTIITITLFRVPSLNSPGSASGPSSPTAPQSKSNDKIVPVTSNDATD